MNMNANGLKVKKKKAIPTERFAIASSPNYAL
jgi:hypothetical protein